MSKNNLTASAEFNVEESMDRKNLTDAEMVAIGDLLHTFNTTEQRE